MGIITIDNATIGYQSMPVATEVSFEIKDGEIVAIVGPNGAGKTTLLKSLVGILPLLKGNVVYGFNLTQHPCGYVPQRDNFDSLFPLTAFDVVLMGRYSKLGFFSSLGKSDCILAENSLRQVGLEHVKNKNFFKLSAGQRQRVLIARALCTQPKIMFLDEPTAGTDAGAEAAIIELLLNLHHQEGLTIVLVSHHLSVVRSFIPFTILVHQGSVEKGSTSNILDLTRAESVFGMMRKSNEHAH